MIVKRALVLGVGLLLLSVFSGQAFAAELKVKVQMKADPDNSKLLIRSKGKCVPATENHNGCLEVGTGDYAKFSFELKDSPGWVLVGMKICKGTRKQDLDCALSKRERVEFVATQAGAAHPELAFLDQNGKLNLYNDLSRSLDSFNLYNQNNLERDWFYLVRACPVNEPPNSPNCLDTDPRIKNKGR